MKHLLLCLALFLGCLNVNAQCTHQVTHLSGTQTINGCAVTVTHAGTADSDKVYCAGSTTPYMIGYNFTTGNGNGSYTFTFVPPVGSVTLNFSGISNLSNNTEEVHLQINGVHYPIPAAGTTDGCDQLAVLTSAGDVGGCLDCSVSGWNGTVINGTISSLTILDTVIEGSPAGSLFSLYICDAVTETFDVANSFIYSSTVFPNPIHSSATMQLNAAVNNADLTIFNVFGQKVQAINNISGSTLKIERENLAGGIYFYELKQQGKNISMGKLIMD